MVDSKDAKAKIHSDVSPVQKPGKTWRKMILPDHDWNRLAHNAVTPMTHLFLKTETILEDKEDNDVFSSVRRTGTAATLLNLSYFEPETVQRVFNELFLLLKNPSLDHLFRNPKTEKLKEHFVCCGQRPLGGPSKSSHENVAGSFGATTSIEICHSEVVC